MTELERAEIRQGLVYPASAGRLGGITTYLDETGERVCRIALAPKTGEEARIDVRVGDTFSIVDERWRVEDIFGSDPHDMVAVIVRIR